MSRGSLREIVLLVALVAVGFAWWLDHCQQQAVIAKATPDAVAAAPQRAASSEPLAVPYDPPPFELPVLEDSQPPAAPATSELVAHVAGPSRGPFIEPDTFVPDFEFFAPGEEPASEFPGKRAFYDCLNVYLLEKSQAMNLPGSSPDELDFDLKSQRDSFSPSLGEE